MTSRVRSLFALSASLIFLCALFASTATRAHPPHEPFLNEPDGKDTRFAPITRFGPNISVEVVADGMTSPLKAIAAPGRRDRLYVLDQPGIVWEVDLNNPDHATNKRIFLDVSARIGRLGVCGPSTFDERGLLGLAFHPNYQDNGLLYTYTSENLEGPLLPPTFVPPLPFAPDHQNVVAEGRVPNPGSSGSVVNPASRRELMRVDWPQFNHDGGDLAFGPDRKLYISMGDGGGADDADGQAFIAAQPRFPQPPPPACGTLAPPITGHQGDGNAQKLNTVLGKILRIDVDGRNSANGQYGIPPGNPFVGKPGLDEIWAYGFRNPYRFSFDKGTGDLYVGDVGQNDIEEVDIVTKGGNFGWNCKEGTLFFHINGPAEGFASRKHDRSREASCGTRQKPKNFVDPIAQYDTHREGHSVIGGFVYHGTRAPVLRGKYVFGDFALLFKFPSGPHDYGRLFTISARGHEDHDGGGHHGLRTISELMVVPGGAISLAVLGMGQDTAGEIYVTGNTWGVPFPAPGNDEELGTSDDVFSGKVVRIVAAEDSRGKHHHGDEDDGDDD